MTLYTYFTESQKYVMFVANNLERVKDNISPAPQNVNDY